MIYAIRVIGFISGAAGDAAATRAVKEHGVSRKSAYALWFTIKENKAETCKQHDPLQYLQFDQHKKYAINSSSLDRT